MIINELFFNDLINTLSARLVNKAAATAPK